MHNIHLEKSVLDSTSHKEGARFADFSRNHHEMKLLKNVLTRWLTLVKSLARLFDQMD